MRTAVALMLAVGAACTGPAATQQEFCDDAGAIIAEVTLLTGPRAGADEPVAAQRARLLATIDGLGHPSRDIAPTVAGLRKALEKAERLERSSFDPAEPSLPDQAILAEIRLAATPLARVVSMECRPPAGFPGTEGESG